MTAEPRFKPGDRVQHLRNELIGTVAAVSADNQLMVRCDSGGVIVQCAGDEVAKVETEDVSE